MIRVERTSFLGFRLIGVEVDEIGEIFGEPG